MIMASNDSRIRVAIIGGGIAGIMLAIVLASHEAIEIDIYEGTAKFEPIGAGLGLWGAAVTVCEKLGIEERLTAITPGVESPSYMALRKANLIEGRDIGNLVLSKTLGFHRGKLLETLVQILKETGRGTIHFSKRCVNYTQSAQNGEEVTINFEDGSTATCDVLVGCDGIKSVVRKQLLNELGWKSQDPDVDSSGLRFTRTVAYRALINAANLGDHPARQDKKTYCGFEKHIVSYPIADGKLINLVAYSSNPARYDEWKNGPWTFDEEGGLQKEFSDLEPEVQVLLQNAPSASRWALYEVEPFPHWSNRCVTVLGDAAHGMTPSIGTGGGQVVEGAYVLGQLLGTPGITRKDMPHVLRSYEYIRKERAEKVLDCTREAKRVFETQDEYANASDERIQETLNRLVRWLWQGEYDLDGEIAKGRKEIERLRREVEGV